MTNRLSQKILIVAVWCPESRQFPNDSFQPRTNLAIFLPVHTDDDHRFILAKNSALALSVEANQIASRLSAVGG